MFAMTGKQGGYDRTERSAAPDGARSLPRPARRVARSLSNLATGRTPIPRHLGSVVAVVFFAACGVNAVMVAGNGEQLSRAAIELSGFSIDDIQISGNVETSEIAVLQSLDLDTSISLHGLDIDRARGQLLNLPWVADADIRKIYPNTLKISLKERKPYALWQQEDGSLLMIEESGNVIGALTEAKFRRLPLVLGQGANLAAKDLDSLLTSWPELSNRVRAYKRIDGRRWDIYLDNGMIVKLPETGTDAAVARLKSLEETRQILEREIAAIDLRLDDRIAIQLTPDALERRDAEVEQLKKSFKNKGVRL